MIDQLRIGNKYSHDDFEASVKEREIGYPKKKSITDTVPFSNKVYDFTKINGEIYWEQRTLKYVFEILAESPEELEEKKQEFATWIMNVHEEELQDPYIEDYHFNATFDSIDADDSEVEKSTITVTFTAYPYMVANKDTVRTVPFGADVIASPNVYNHSSHRITPTITSDVEFTLRIGNNTYGLNAGTYTDERFRLEVGDNRWTVSSTTNGTVEIRFREEVL